MVGHRVVVRRRVAVGASRYSDVLGYLVAVRDGTLIVRPATGEEVPVPVGEVHRIKAVPPPPARVTRDDVLALEQVAALGWRAPETARLGGWLLRAGEGFTNRANSVLALGDPDRPLPEALAHAEEWYAARGLPTRFQVALPALAEFDAELDRHGYTVAASDTHVLTASVAEARAAAGPARAGAPPVRLDTEPSADWLALYHHRGARSLPPIAGEIMTAHERVVFASCVRDGEIAAIARAVVDAGWIGVTALEVGEQYRRQGLANHVMAGVLGWAADAGAEHAYLQVVVDNAPALALYGRLRFTRHHRYHYRSRP